MAPVIKEVCALYGVNHIELQAFTGVVLATIFRSAPAPSRASSESLQGAPDFVTDDGGKWSDTQGCAVNELI